MRKFIILMLVMASVYFCSAQSRVNESRQTKGYHEFPEIDNKTKKLKTDTSGQVITQDVGDKVQFTIEDDKGSSEYYIIYFWEYDTSDVKYHQLNYDTLGKAKYFGILKTDLDVLSRKIYRTVAPTIGAMTLPFKYRPQSGKFEKTFTVGLTGGITINPWWVGDHTFSILAGVSATTATLDKYNTDPAAGITDPSDRAAIAFSMGFFYKWENLQIGFSAGIDNILDNEIVKWKYQSKGWLSFGIGISLFTANEVNNPGTNK